MSKEEQAVTCASEMMLDSVRKAARDPDQVSGSIIRVKVLFRVGNILRKLALNFEAVGLHAASNIYCFILLLDVTGLGKFVCRLCQMSCIARITYTGSGLCGKLAWQFRNVVRAHSVNRLFKPQRYRRHLAGQVLKNCAVGRRTSSTGQSLQISGKSVYDHNLHTYKCCMHICSPRRLNFVSLCLLIGNVECYVGRFEGASGRKRRSDGGSSGKQGSSTRKKNKRYIPCVHCHFGSPNWSVVPMVQLNAGGFNG